VPQRSERPAEDQIFFSVFPFDARRKFAARAPSSISTRNGLDPVTSALRPSESNVYRTSCRSQRHASARRRERPQRHVGGCRFCSPFSLTTDFHVGTKVELVAVAQALPALNRASVSVAVWPFLRLTARRRSPNRTRGASTRTRSGRADVKRDAAGCGAPSNVAT